MLNDKQKKLPLTHQDTDEGRLFAAYKNAKRCGINNLSFRQALANEQVSRVLHMAAEAGK